jgi:hypothetical protein
MTKKILLSVFLLPAVMTFAQQYGGMWIPTELNEKEMKDLGMKISAKDIFNPQKASIKDAVVQFNGGCTAKLSLQKVIAYQPSLWIRTDSVSLYGTE